MQGPGTVRVKDRQIVAATKILALNNFGTSYDDREDIFIVLYKLSIISVFFRIINNVKKILLYNIPVHHPIYIYIQSIINLFDPIRTI